MPTKAEFCIGKAVLVRVYVEGPRRRRLSSSNNNHQHHYHHVYHHHLHYRINNQEATPHSHRDVAKGYDRRAQLLHYSRQLRESARPAAASSASSPLLLTPAVFHSQQNENSSTNSAAIKRRTRHSKNSICIWNCKLLNSNYLKSFITPEPRKASKKTKQSGFTSHAMKAAMKSLEVRKKRGFFSKLISMLRHSR